jgi:hypothetical protein
MEWIALRDVCSPSSLCYHVMVLRLGVGSWEMGGIKGQTRGEKIPENMISLSLPFPCFTKNSFSPPSFPLLVILKVDAKPLPPCEAIVVVAASSESAWRITGSIVGAMICDLRAPRVR